MATAQDLARFQAAQAAERAAIAAPAAAWAALTPRQRDVLAYVRQARVVGSGSEGSVLRALAATGLVIQGHNQAPGYVYYTWTLSRGGEAVVAEIFTNSLTAAPKTA